VLKVGFTGALRSSVNGHAQVDAQAGTIRELLSGLVQRYPDLAEHVEQGIAVALDGEIYRDDWSKPIPDGSTVFLLPRIQGG
jgi:molybdopterin converting factor small subunit